MHLTKFSDFALRVLMLAAARDGARLTIEETATTYGISQAHLKKVVLTLSRAGYLTGMKGRTGGYALARKPEDINLGAVLRVTETDFSMFECVHDGQACMVMGACRLPVVARAAVQGFLAAFDKVTLRDVILPNAAFSVAQAVQVPKSPG